MATPGRKITFTNQKPLPAWAVKRVQGTFTKEVKLEQKRVEENPGYKPTWVMTEDGKTVNRIVRMRHGNERGKFDIGSHVHAEQWENICSLEHSRLSIYYHATSPTAILSIAPCGFAGCIGAGCDEMLNA